MQMTDDFTCLKSCNSILAQMKNYGEPIALVTQISSKNVAYFTVGLEEKPDFEKIYKGWQRLGKMSVTYNVLVIFARFLCRFYSIAKMSEIPQTRQIWNRTNQQIEHWFIIFFLPDI